MTSSNQTRTTANVSSIKHAGPCVHAEAAGPAGGDNLLLVSKNVLSTFQLGS